MPVIYDALSSWYPLLDPLADHEEEAADIAEALLAAGVPEGGALLELGCGAGNNAHFLSRRFRCTLTDLSPQMLERSRAQNPGCTHVLGDMRTLRLEGRFDAVVVHDALCYLLTEADLLAMMTTAFVHLKPGGMAHFAPDCVRETFCEWTEEHEADDGARTMRTLSWAWDPDPTDTRYAVEYAYLMREDGVVRVVHDHHEEGLFPTETWERLLREAGFESRRLPREAEGIEGTGYCAFGFLGIKPGEGAHLNSAVDDH